MIKVGDIVARSYEWPNIISGIVVAAHEEETMGIPKEDEFGYPFTISTFTVAWSNGAVTRELDLELVLFDNIMESR